MALQVQRICLTAFRRAVCACSILVEGLVETTIWAYEQQRQSKTFEFPTRESTVNCLCWTASCSVQ